MKKPSRLFPLLLGLSLAMAPLGLLAKKSELPDVTEDGLHRVKKPKNSDAAYIRPGVDFGIYNTVVVMEPYIAFRKNWQDDINFQRRTDRISDRDMEKMIREGKELFLKEFKRVLEKEGYPVVDAIGSDTMIVRPAIINLDVYAPDPNRTAGIWNKVYTDGAGQASLYVELYDGPTSQILAKAFDHKDGSMEGMSWRIPRTYNTNKNDARDAMNDWAHALVNGLKKAKEEKLDQM